MRLRILDLFLEAGRYLALSPQSRLRQRAALRELDRRLLADIGVTTAEAARGRRLHTSSFEAAKAAKPVTNRQESTRAKSGPAPTSDTGRTDGRASRQRY
jgi:hypothetical protein